MYVLTFLYKELEIELTHDMFRISAFILSLFCRM